MMVWCTLEQKEGLAYANEQLRTVSAHQHETSRIAKRCGHQAPKTEDCFYLLHPSPASSTRPTGTHLQEASPKLYTSEAFISNPVRPRSLYILSPSSTPAAFPHQQLSHRTWTSVIRAVIKLIICDSVIPSFNYLVQPRFSVIQ